MRLILINILIFFIIVGCAKKADEELINNRIALLSYASDLIVSAEMSINDIRLESPKKINYWSQSGQNPQHNLFHLESNTKLNKKKKLISDSGKITNTIQPIYFEGSVCNVSTKGYLRCFNLESKKKIFEIDIKPDNLKRYEIMRGGIAYFDEKIILVDGYGQIKVLNSRDGTIIWEKNISFPILSAPLIYRGNIYFITLNNKIYSLSLLNGETLWSFQTVFDDKKSIFTATPAAVENVIIAPFGNGELIAFIYNTGDIIWTENVSKVSSLSNFDIKDIAANPVISNDKIYTISNNGKFLSTKIINGSSDWSIEISGNNSPIISGLQIYIIDDESRLICINKTNGQIYWVKQLDKTKNNRKSGKLNNWKGPYLINEKLYLISAHGEIVSISPITSEILENSNIGLSNISINPIILSETIILMDGSSNIYRVD